MKKLSSTQLLRCIWAGILIMVIIGSILPGTKPPGSDIGLDLVFHFTCYGLLACLPIFMFTNRKHALLLSLSMAPMGYLIELIQKNVDGRTFSAEDMIANNLGVFLGIFIGAVIRLRNHYRRQKS